MSFPGQLLASAIEYRGEPQRIEELPSKFESVDDMRDEMEKVLKHEAREALQKEIQVVPHSPYLHLVDLECDDPGIVDEKDSLHVLRLSTPPGSSATHAATPGSSAAPSFDRRTIFNVGDEEATKKAEKDMTKRIKKSESYAAAAEKRKRRQEDDKERRKQETEEERKERLAIAKMKRKERKDRKRIAEEGAAEEVQTMKEGGMAEDGTRGGGDEDGDGDEAVMEDVTAVVGKKKARVGKLKVFENVVPHFRHIESIHLCDPHPNLCNALAEGLSTPHLLLVDGPPGTGKTRELVNLISDFATGSRILLCAPTNIGATNLYTRCVDQGWGEECCLALPSSRIPAGTRVLSNDPSRRIVCATISSRGGPRLNNEVFDVVMVDEAAQCMEAWVWTLLRSDVQHLVCAGDVRQLPAIVSETGSRLQHNRSIMERLMHIGYENVRRLTIQNRMAPELLSFPNASFYGGTLQTGPHAPTQGEVIFLRVEGSERRMNTSFANAEEAARAAEEAKKYEGSVIITPYLAQCQLLASMRPGREVQTVDAFQGREADTIILSTVRDGSAGLGFWEDERRVAVALTRARSRLIVVCSPSSWPENSLLSFAYSSLLRSRHSFEFSS